MLIISALRSGDKRGRSLRSQLYRKSDASPVAQGGAGARLDEKSVEEEESKKEGKEEGKWRGEKR